MADLNTPAELAAAGYITDVSIAVKAANDELTLEDVKPYVHDVSVACQVYPADAVPTAEIEEAIQDDPVVENVTLSIAGEGDEVISGEFDKTDKARAALATLGLKGKKLYADGAAVSITAAMTVEELAAISGLTIVAPAPAAPADGE